MTMPSPSVAPAPEVYQRGIETAVLAEELGFSHVWLAEHHFTNYSYLSRPVTLLSYLAARTRRIRLGTAIVPLPLHHPLLVAEELAALDVLSGGRVEIGLGKGYQQYQYDRFGMGTERDIQRYEESIDVVRLALTEEVFSYTGESFQIPETRLYPQPIQRQPPFWLVVNTTVREGIVDAVRRGMNMFTGVLEPIAKLTDMRVTYPDLFPADAPPLRIGTQRPVYVAESEADAQAAIEQVRWNGRISLAMRHNFASLDHGRVLPLPLPKEPSNDFIQKELVVIGTPDQCIAQLRRIQKGLGADYFSASFWFGELPHDAVLGSMQRFARDVAPAFAS
jgi:alkanesulfonate monooxygenase SsuD/methylene tetrahydromethanopterin reductase-like flavin-dependent oxidoreductase (luciferase family)